MRGGALFMSNLPDKKTYESLPWYKKIQLFDYFSLAAWQSITGKLVPAHEEAEMIKTWKTKMQDNPIKPIYMNVFRDKDGLTYSCYEFGGDTQALHTLDDVKADIYDALVYKRGEYVSTLSNDGESYTDAMQRFAMAMERAIDQARAYDLEPQHFQWYEIEAAVMELSPEFQALYCKDTGETFFQRRG